MPAMTAVVNSDDMNSSPKRIRSSSSLSGLAKVATFAAASNGGGSRRPEIIKSRSAKSLLGSTKGTMKNLRNLVGMSARERSSSGHKSLRQFDQLASDPEGDHMFTEESNISHYNTKQGPEGSFSELVNGDGSRAFPGATNDQVDSAREGKVENTRNRDRHLNEEDESEEGSDFYSSPTSVMESVDSVDSSIDQSKKPKASATSGMHKSASAQEISVNRGARRNNNIKGKTVLRKSNSFGANRGDGATTTSRSPKRKQEAKSMHHRTAGRSNNNKSPKRQQQHRGGGSLLKSRSLRGLRVTEVSAGPALCTDNQSMGSGSSGSQPRESRGDRGMSKRKSRSLRSLNVSDFMAPASTHSKASPQSKDYRIRALNSSEQSTALNSSQQSTQHSRRSRRTSDETDSSSRNGSVKKSQSMRGLRTTGLNDHSSLDQNSKRSMRSSYTNNSTRERRGDRHKSSSSSVRGPRMDYSDPGYGQNVSRRNRRTTDAETSPKRENKPIRKSKSMRGLGMADNSDQLYSDYKSGFNGRSSGSTAGSAISNHKLTQSGHHRRSSDGTEGNADPRKERRRRSNSASRRMTKTHDEESAAPVPNNSGHSKKSLKDSIPISSAVDQRKQRRRRSNSASRRITRSQDDGSVASSKNSLNVSNHSKKSLDSSNSNNDPRKQGRRRSNSASRRITRTLDDGSISSSKKTLTTSNHSKMSPYDNVSNPTDVRKQRRRRSNSASKRLTRSQDDGSAAEMASSIHTSSHSKKSLKDVSSSNDDSRRSSDHSRSNYDSSSRRMDDNSGSRRRSKSGSRSIVENKSRGMDDNSGQGQKSKSGTRTNNEERKSTGSTSKNAHRPIDISNSNRSRSMALSSLTEEPSESTNTTRSRSKTRIANIDTVNSKNPPRSRSKGSHRKIEAQASDMSLDLHTVTSVSSLSAGTARPSRGSSKSKKLRSHGKATARKRSKSATRRIVEEPAIMADGNLPRRSTADSYIGTKATPKPHTMIQQNCDYQESNFTEKSSRKQRSKSGQGMNELKSKVRLLRHCVLPPQGRKQSIDNSVSSITVSSKYHHDDMSLASDQRSHLRRAFSSPKLFFDGPYGSSFRHGEEDESTIGDVQARGGSRASVSSMASASSKASRWQSSRHERNETAPTIPEHDVSSVSSSFVQSRLTRNTDNNGRWSNSTNKSNVSRSNYGEFDGIPARHDKEVSTHSRTYGSYYEPSTPSQHSVMTGMISELTPITFAGGGMDSVAGNSRAGGARPGRSEETEEYGAWRTSLHSLLLQDEQRPQGGPPASRKCDTVPRMARRHSFDSISYVDNVADLEYDADVRSVKSGFTDLMKYDGENDRNPQRPSRRESNGSSVFYHHH